MPAAAHLPRSRPAAHGSVADRFADSHGPDSFVCRLRAGASVQHLHVARRQKRACGSLPRAILAVCRRGRAGGCCAARRSAKVGAAPRFSQLLRRIPGATVVRCRVCGALHGPERVLLPRVHRYGYPRDADVCRRSCLSSPARCVGGLGAVWQVAPGGCWPATRAHGPHPAPASSPRPGLLRRLGCRRRGERAAGHPRKRRSHPAAAHAALHRCGDPVHPRRHGSSWGPPSD